uniref:Uncharacterized protein n=1 Tax=Tetranychus urticae TaxID=32264 RepID=T1KFI5_TETUR
MAKTVIYYFASLVVAVNLIQLCSTGMKDGKGGCGVKVVAIETIKFKKVPVMYPEESKMYQAKSMMMQPMMMQPMKMQSMKMQPMMMQKMAPMMMMGGGGGGWGWGSSMPMGMGMKMSMGKKG